MLANQGLGIFSIILLIFIAFLFLVPLDQNLNFSQKLVFLAINPYIYMKLTSIGFDNKKSSLCYYIQPKRLIRIVRPINVLYMIGKMIDMGI